MSAATVLLVGVGGHGVLTAARLLLHAALLDGSPVIGSQAHGMSQRGGSVATTVIFGPQRCSFLLEPPTALLAFEPLEALNALPQLGPRTQAIVNTTVVAPTAAMGHGRYPPIDEIAQTLRSRIGGVRMIDATARLAGGDPRAVNLVMLGALAGADLLPIGPERIWQAIAEKLSDSPANRRAFEAGLDERPASRLLMVARRDD